MSDVMTPEQRKKAMRANRGRTKPEHALATTLWQSGLRYLTAEGYKRKRGVAMQGHPDMIFPSRRLVVFVDGCFWHGCPRCKRVPPNMSAFWLEKIRTNITRDRRVTSDLRRRGWKVIRVWEHTIRARSGLATKTNELARRIKTM